MDLKLISKPIVKNLESFNVYFKEVMKTDVALLNLVLKYITNKKGKQIRPVLVFLSAGLCGQISQRTNIGAAMIELLHTATLVHDDVVDKATVRRGIASINAEWNNKVAVLVGDFLLSKGLQVSANNDEFGFLKITSKAVQLMSESELLAIDKSRKFTLDEETYINIINGKTASLISSCCEIGALSSSDNKEDTTNLSEFGTNLGLAFQIRDDMLDYVSKSSLIGKPVGNDLKEKKITLPLIYSLQQVDKTKQKEIIKLVKSGNLKSKDINYILDFVKDTGGVQYAQEQASMYCTKAKENISKYPESVYKSSLEKLTDFVIDRNS